MLDRQAFHLLGVQPILDSFAMSLGCIDLVPSTGKALTIAMKIKATNNPSPARISAILATREAQWEKLWSRNTPDWISATQNRREKKEESSIGKTLPKLREKEKLENDNNLTFEQRMQLLDKKAKIKNKEDEREIQKESMRGLQYVAKNRCYGCIVTKVRKRIL